MALNETRTWLIAYDIASPRRLQRVHRYLKTVAVPVQYSVFVAEETTRGIQGIRDELAQEINPKTDDVRIYPLPKRPALHHYGRRALPEGLQLLADRENRSSGILAGTPPHPQATPER